MSTRRPYGTSRMQSNDAIVVPGAPAIPGLTFRSFRGESDYPAMVAVIVGSKDADGVTWAIDPDDTVRTYQHLVNCDPYQDMLFAEQNGQVIGYSRVWWQEESDGTRLYCQFVHLLPAWRPTGLRRAMLRHNERRLREIASDHPQARGRFFEAWASDSEVSWETLLLSEGYEIVRYGFEMVRPNLDDIPELRLPERLEVRPVRPEHYWIIWRAVEEAMQDHWGAQPWRDEWFEEWMEDPTFDPSLWQVAWDGDKVAGNVLNFVDTRENEEYKRKRGYTEYISVRRPLRRKGLARALIARSLQVLKDQGMSEAALGVDAENPSGALGLYESMGFRKVKQSMTFRKSLEQIEQGIPQ